MRATVSTPGPGVSVAASLQDCADCAFAARVQLGAYCASAQVASSDAHDLGLCAADAATKALFARDLRNLTLASPRVNRHEKNGKDAAEWVPQKNRCWFAGRVIEVRRAYRLTIDRCEAAVLEGILSGYKSPELNPIVCSVPSCSGTGVASAPSGGDDALALYDDNRNGRITCAKARWHGIAPVGR